MVLKSNTWSAPTRRSIYAALGAGFLALILGIILARTLTQPLRELTTAIHAMSKGDLKQHVSVKSHDEIGELANAFNQMSSDLDRLNRSRRQMTADIAHDLRTPLTVIGGYIESMQDGVLKPSHERLEIIHSEVEHLQRLVEDLRTLSQADAGELSLNRTAVTPAAFLERMSKSYGHLAAQKEIILETHADPDLPEVRFDPDRMAQVFGNLITNSIRYTPENGTITLSALREKDCLALTVQDNGSGITQRSLAPYLRPVLSGRSRSPAGERIRPGISHCQIHYRSPWGQHLRRKPAFCRYHY